MLFSRFFLVFSRFLLVFLVFHVFSLPEAILAQGHFIQEECSLVIRWERPLRGKKEKQYLMDGVARYRPEHDVKRLSPWLVPCSSVER